MFVFQDLVVPAGVSPEFALVLEESLEWLYYDIYVGRVYMDHDAFWPEATDVLQAATKRFWARVDDSLYSLAIKNHVALLVLAVSRRALIDVYDERADRRAGDAYAYSASLVAEAIETMPEMVEIPRALTVLVKMQEGSLKDFSDNELKRVFWHLAGPAYCRRVAKAMIVSGNLRSVNDIPKLINYGKPLYATPAVMNAIWE